jgi:DNA-binding transcriptional ArsR family regulator
MTMTEDRLDAAFAALADPTRRAIVSRLAKGDATVNELAARFPMSLPGVSKHLKVLERSGLISRRRDAQFRPCHLEVGALDGAVDWIGEHRRIWDERFDKLDAHLRDIGREAGDEKGDRKRRGRGPLRAQGTPPGKARGKARADD